ncbi:MAG TPA: TRAP transporter substrate-binding protein [Burkholderiales bacterium]|nr:TRAP transporter substrate-binding protein [Burkholderiales bacterium]
MRKIVLIAALAAAMPAAAEPVVLKFNSPAPPPSFLHAGAFNPWAKAVSEASGGTLKVEMYYGGTLGGFGVTYDRVLDGVADIGFILTALAKGKFRQEDVAALPFESKSSLAAATALWKIYEKGITAGEFDAVKPLGIWTFPNSAVNSRNPVRSLADLKGRKVTVSNPIAGRTVVALGAGPVAMPPSDVYQALSRGLADMALMPFTGVATFKIDDVAKHHVDVALGADSAVVFMNRKKWDSLPAQAKAAIDRYSYLPFSEMLGKAADAEWARSRRSLKEVTTLSDAEEARWKKLLAPVAEQWAHETPNGQKVLEAFRSEIAAFEASHKGR